MSILSGYGKYKRYILTSEGYKLCSQWTSSNTVEMGDGNTAETNLGSIKGITDSLTATSSNIALSASAGNNLQTQVDTLNSNLETLNTAVGGKQTALKTWTHTFTNVTLKAGTYVKLGTAPSGIRPSNMISIFPYLFGNVGSSVVVELENDGNIYAWSSDASYGNSTISIKIVYV